MEIIFNTLSSLSQSSEFLIEISAIVIWNKSSLHKSLHLIQGSNWCHSNVSSLVHNLFPLVAYISTKLSCSKLHFLLFSVILALKNQFHVSFPLHVSIRIIFTKERWNSQLDITKVVISFWSWVVTSSGSKITPS